MTIESVHKTTIDGEEYELRPEICMVFGDDGKGQRIPAFCLYRNGAQIGIIYYDVNDALADLDEIRRTGRHLEPLVWVVKVVGEET